MSSNNLMKLALGSVSLIQPVTGIGQYTLNLSHALMKIHCLDIQHFYGYDWSSLGAPKNSPKLSLIKKLLKEVIPRPYEVNRLANPSSPKPSARPSPAVLSCRSPPSWNPRRTWRRLPRTTWRSGSNLTM